MPATELRPDVSVVVPVFRNAASLGELAERVDRALSPTPYELVFVDDASPDDTTDVIAALARTDTRIVAVGLRQNVGQNAAVVAGLRRARGYAVVVMDADLQDPPEAVPSLLTTLVRGDADVVFAGRRGHYEGAVRLAGGRLLKLALWAFTGRKVPPAAGLFVAMRQSVADRVVASAPPDPYVLVLIARAGRVIQTVPVERAPARGSSYTARMRWRVARRALAAALRR
jgi:polyisoprenyl-phosphate glycosyltransferase